VELRVVRFGCLNFRILRFEKDLNFQVENLQLKQQGVLRSNNLSLRRFIRQSNDAFTNCGVQVGFHEEVFQMLAF
jgi:hypothetical protein